MLDHVPQLELVPSSGIRFHEHPERKRTLRLVDRLRDEKRLRNPPIVTSARPHEYILLDGANRVSALQELGYTLIPVQVIDYADPEVRLKGWHHLLLEGRALNLKSVYEGLPGVAVAEVARDELALPLELRRLYAVFVDETAACWGLFPERGPGAPDLEDWMRVLEQVIAAYEGRTRLERIKLADYDSLPDVFRHMDHQLLLFPVLTKVELVQLVERGVMIPTGITRHLIPGRALGLNLDLEFLGGPQPDEDKVQQFRKVVDDLELHGRIRFYEESAFIMNE